MPNETIPPRRGNHFSGGDKSHSNQQTRRPAGPSETAEFTNAYFQSNSQVERKSASASTQFGSASHRPLRQTPMNTRQSASTQNSQRAGGAAPSNTPIRKGSLPYGPTRIDDRSQWNSKPSPRGRVKIVAGVIGALAALILVVSGVCGFFMYRDYKDITAKVPTLTEEAKTLQEAVMNGDGENLRNTAASVASEISAINSTLHGIHWDIASLFPVVGQDVSTVKTVIEQADTLCQYALIPACDSLSDLSLSNLMVDGGFNVDLLKSLVSTLQNVAPVITQSAEIVNDLPEPTIDRLAEIVAQVKDGLTAVDSASRSASEIAPYLPQMLGADGEVRNYLILAQNSSELRSTGGFPGSAGVLTVSNGQLTLGDFVAMGIDGMHWYDTPGFGVTDEELIIFGDALGSNNRIGRIPADTNIIPDFSRVSQIISSMWTDQQGGSIDGVVAIDTIFLQNLMAVTGASIQSYGFTIDGTNAASQLIHNVYNGMTDTDAQDSLFSGVASEAFNQLIGNLGNANPVDLMQTIETAINDHRLQVYMFNADEESIMVRLGCSGTILTDPATPELGVYVSDDTYSKIAWFLSLHTVINSSTKNSDGTTTYNVTTTLTNNLDPNDAYNQVDYITGYNTAKRNRSDMIDKVYLFAPAGGSISDVTINGYIPAEFPLKEGSYNGNQVWYVTLQTSGLETSTLTYSVTTASGAADLSIRQTPTAQEAAGWQ